MGELYSPQIRPQESGFQAGPELQFIPVIPTQKAEGEDCGFQASHTGGEDE